MWKISGWVLEASEGLCFSKVTDELRTKDKCDLHGAGEPVNRPQVEKACCAQCTERSSGAASVDVSKRCRMWRLWGAWKGWHCTHSVCDVRNKEMEQAKHWAALL